MQVGQRIRSLRKRQGLTIEALASKAELDPTYLGGIERGVHNPTLRVVVRVSLVLGVEMASLLCPELAEDDASVLRATLAERAATLDAEQLRLVLRLMDAIRL